MPYPPSFLEAAAQALGGPIYMKPNAVFTIKPKNKPKTSIFTHKPPKKKKPIPSQAEFDFWQASYRPHEYHDVFVGRSPDKDRVPVTGKDFAEHYRSIYTAPADPDQWDWYYPGELMKMHVPNPELGLGW